MATYKMLKTQRGVRTGGVHPVVFHEGKTYEIDDNLAGEFDTLEAIEPSEEEVSVAESEDGRDDLHENWLDTDPAVLRHGELTAAEVVARDESANPQTTAAEAPDQEEGKAEGEVDGEETDDSTDGTDGKPARGKKAADKAK